MATTASRADILTNLTAVKQRQDAERRARIALMLQARDSGIPNTHIAEALGVTETAVRAMLKRATSDSKA